MKTAQVNAITIINLLSRWTACYEHLKTGVEASGAIRFCRYINQTEINNNIVNSIDDSSIIILVTQVGISLIVQTKCNRNNETDSKAR